MKLAIITDQHFGVRNDNKHLLRSQVQFYEKVFFPTLEEHGITTVLDLGDTFDRRKFINYQTLKVARESYFDVLAAKGIDLHAVLGNHTTYYKNTNEVNSLSLLLGEYDNVRIYEEDPVELVFDGCKIMLSPWMTATNTQSSLEAFAKTDAQILMGHFEIQGYEMMRGQVCDHGLDRNLFSKFDLVFSGHFHHPSKYGNIEYLGAPYEMTWTDFGGKRGFHIFDTDTREHTHIQNPYRNFIRIDYDDREYTVEDIEALDTSPANGAYVKVVIESKDNPYILDLLVSKLESAGAVDVKVVEDFTNGYLEEDDVLDEAADTSAIINQYVDNLDTKVEKSQVKSLLGDLYREAISIK